ncbi:MAG: gamma carbonic anhydrase family protein, partial [Thermoplasmata archaeon]
IMISAFGKYLPTIGKDTYIDEYAKVIGRVNIGNRCAIFPGAVVRADDDEIKIDDGVVVLDNAIIESPKGFPVTIGKNAIVSHGAIVHGAIVYENAVVGIGSIMLEGSRLGSYSILAAGSLLPNGKNIEDRKVALGRPAEIKREVNKEDIDRIMNEHNALLEKAKIYLGKSVY